MVPERVLAIDPGREKCGWVLWPPESSVLSRGILGQNALLEKLAVLVGEGPLIVVVGDGTHGNQVVSAMKLKFPEMVIYPVDERNSTLEARVLYFRDHPPSGLWAYLPLGMVPVMVPLDDYAAEVLLIRFLTARKDPLPKI